MKRLLIVSFLSLLLGTLTWPLSATTFYVDASVSQSGDGRTWQTAFKTIQMGIDAAADGDTVIVGHGIYVENIDFGGKNIILTSTNPLDADIVAATIIDGNQAGSVVTFAGTENESCTLSGFTIRNGNSDRGGGILGGTRDDRTRAVIRSNVIVDNWADQSGGGLAYCDGAIGSNVVTENSADYGAGLYRCEGPIQQNEVCVNSAEFLGGGLYACHGVIQNNLVSGNSGRGLYDCDGLIQNNLVSGNSAGGLYDCDGPIQNNVISGNSGGGLNECDGLINNNTISENSAIVGGGLAHCDGTIQGNEISRNSASSSGGGLYCCDRIIQNNTVAHNFAPRGGGLYDCDGIVENNRIAWNDAGGLVECDGTIQNNTILNNASQRGSGGGLDRCDGTIQNNLIAGNRPGLQYCHGLIRDNTIVANRASVYPYSIRECAGTITNCVIWGNEAYAGTQLKDSSQPTYSCIQDWTGGGDGNIAEDPRFVDPDGPDDDRETHEDNDYRLLPDSPCIDTGFNHLDLPAKDIAGMRRIMYGGKSLTVDMGAYEYYINELNRGPGSSETTLTWSSIAGSTYVILYSNDLVIWILADAGIASAGNQTTSWIDDGSKTGIAPTVAPRRFYRVLENR